MDNVLKLDVITILSLALALRSIISLHSFSGESKSPMYGDYEAQRHWQEITLNLKPSDWYKNTTENDLQYWGLDYPPLTAYHSYFLGVIGQYINKSYVDLETSRGFESSEHKSFMRLTVLFADLILYLPAMLILGLTLEKTFKRKMLLPVLMVLTINPSQILIDNGHFQYNNISLGLAALAISSILRNKYTVGACCFTLALNYKQMELYHSLPFFAYLLKVSFSQDSVYRKINTFMKIAFTVLVTFVVLWFPWIDSVDSVTTVLKRLFPITRGVFEDKVANFWCSLNVIWKLKNNYSNQVMVFVCFITTFLTALPINTMLFLAKRKEIFLSALTNTSMAFFLFSFQVHEKSILLVTLPASCLFIYQPQEVIWFLEVATFSMFPLLIRDGLALSYLAMFSIFFLPFKLIYMNNSLKNQFSKLNVVKNLSTFCILAISISSVIVPAPHRYPFLWSLIIALISCTHFFVFLLYNIWFQYIHTRKIKKLS